MRRAVVLLSALAGLVVVACEPGNTPAGRGSTSKPPLNASPSPGIPAAHTNAAWNDDFGRVVAIQSLDGGQPVSFVRDTTAMVDLPVELLSHDAVAVMATLHPGATAGSCGWQRNATLTLADGAAAPGTWSLALSPGVATPLGIDGVEDMTSRDSAVTVARISRLVSAIPDDSASAPYRGLPVVVRDVWRIKLSDTTAVLVAIAMRSLNVESDPRAQAITLIAEPDPSAGTGQWRTVYSERVAGAEDRVEGTDLLAAFMVRGTTPAVAFVRDGGTGARVEMVERAGGAMWAVRWSSAALPCAQP